jgi:ubiquinone/menaquinone biosynthesis C-methylase UbiE
MRKRRWNPLYWVEMGMWSWHGSTWDDILQLDEYRAGMERVTDCLQRHGRSPNERILDLGCGTGNYSLAMARAGHRVTGMDFAPGMLTKARLKLEKEPSLSLSFQRGDFNRPLPFADGSFDHVTCIAALQCVIDPARFLQEVNRTLRTGGTFFGVFRDTSLRERRRVQAMSTKSSRLAWAILLPIKLRAGRSRWATLYSETSMREHYAAAGLEVLERHPFYPNTIGLLGRSLKRNDASPAAAPDDATVRTAVAD